MISEGLLDDFQLDPARMLFSPDRPTQFAIDFDPEVADSLSVGKPVVALESTLITHGLPYPDNVEAALGMETAVKQAGATPATIAIIGGRVKIGLEAGQIEYLASQASRGDAQSGPRIRKCSRRDLPIVIAQAEDGATTVAGTMFLAQLTGIRLFATGGIGGVHRGHPHDVSADLTELGRTPVTVVCSGAKAILDLPATREVLETYGIPIVGYGTDELPAFFSRASGLAVDMRVDEAGEVARIIRIHRALNLQSGILLTVPVPADAALDPQEVESVIAQATREADAEGITGPAATPWLLRRVSQLTGGKTLRSNVTLLCNNARVAAEVAVALSNLD